MLPCKKRKVAEQPRAKPKGSRAPQDQGSSASPSTGKGLVLAADASESNEATEELDEGGEAKPPKNLQLKGENTLKKETHVFTIESPKQSSQARKSLQLGVNTPGNLKQSKSSDGSPADDEERDDTALFIPVEEQVSPVGEKKRKKRKATGKQKRERSYEEESSLSGDLNLDDILDRTLEDGAKQHKLTAINVRNILHEVITNEHVVAMMKAAINETEDMPMFEPKMTRSKLKEVVEKGVVIPTWNISPIKKSNEIKPPQFVDIPLEEEDSSDEEYQPEEEDEDETAEESLLESDVESTSSSPRGPKGFRVTTSELMETDEEAATSPKTKVCAPPFRHISAEVVPMGPPPPPPKPRQNKDSMFMEKLHAVDEELASSPVCMDSFQPLDESLIAFRTRSKRPLKDIPLGQLEAELCAPDITPDMYDPSTTDDEDWKKWLQGLMNDDAGNEDEADDDDDPEYNFLEDLDEPDTEDFRNDRAVRITKKEVNELMEELFETFQDEMGFSNMDDDGQEDEDSSPESHSTFNTPQAIRFEEPLANLLNEQHRTVRQQLELLRLKKSVRQQQQQQQQTPECEDSKSQNEKSAQILTLDPGQKRRLQQQMQQHVQLLTQMHLLSSNNPGLSCEANTARMFLMELATFASNSTLLHRLSNPEFQTFFEPCNLRESLQLIEDFHAQVPVDWSPHKAEKKNAHDFPCLPRHVAWVMATRCLFMYPELLSVCSLKAKNPRDKVFFTKAEDNLLALGLKHFEGTEFPKPLMSKYLLTAKTAHQLTVRIKNLNMKRTPENIIKYYKRTKLLPILFKCCDDIQPHEARPPVEREEQRLPFWVKASLTAIQEEMRRRKDAEEDSKSSPDGEAEATSGDSIKASVKEGPETAKVGQSGKYPLIMPKGLVLTLKPVASRFSKRAWRQKRSSILNPLLMKPTPAVQSGLCSTNIHKNVAKPIAAEAPSNRAIQPATVMQTVSSPQPLSISSAVGNLSVTGSQPATFQPKIMLPMLASTRVRKPCIRRGQKKKMATKAPPVLKTTPLTHPAPVIFTVPAGTVKLVSLGGGCSVIQSVNTGANRTTQGMPVTTVLVNTTTFSCPLTQPLVTSPLFVSSNPLTVPIMAPQAVVEAQSTNVKNVCPVTGGEVSQLLLESKISGSVLDSSVPVEQYKEEHSPGVLDGSRDEVSKDDSDVVVKTEKEEYQPCTGQRLICPASEEQVATEELMKSDLSEEVLEKQGSAQKQIQQQECPLRNEKEDLVLDIEKELDVVTPQEGMSKQEAEIKTENAVVKDPVEVPASKEREKEGTNETERSKGHSESTKSMSVSTDAELELDADLGSPAGKPEDSSSADGHSVGTPTGPETGREKEGQDEEEEEDFDDLTQDEEDEEMSSASEESVLSVPELQETMEKLTWLASERRLSQEGDSEEENSQEENSEPEEEEEEEAEGVENLQKDEEMVDEVSEDLVKKISSACASPKALPEVESNTTPQGDRNKGACKGRGSHRARSKRGRTRASKDTSKLLLLYDENILQRDPLRDQKDLAFAQAYLTRVREALQDVPGKYEEFLRVIFEFETSSQPQTAVQLYSSLRGLLLEWPQLLKDFAAFLLPEQALECGLFEEQQAFDKSRRFLRQLEICFAENPSHHQKIIRVLQSCADCFPQEITQLKTQVWQLLKGHDHLQDEFSMFFDQLRPPASRMGDFEVINWTEEKEYEFDGFEEVVLPDMEEEEEPAKMHTSSKSKRRKETHEKELEWAEGVKECSCTRADGGTEQRVKKSKRRICSHCSSKACDSKSIKTRDSQEGQNGSPPGDRSPQKDAGIGRITAEERPDERERAEVELLQDKKKASLRRSSGCQSEGKSPAVLECPVKERVPPDKGLVQGLQPPCSATTGEVPSSTDTLQHSSPGTAESYEGLYPPELQPTNTDSPAPENSGKGCGHGRTGVTQKPSGTGKPQCNCDLRQSSQAISVSEHLLMRSRQQSQPVASEFSHRPAPLNCPSATSVADVGKLSIPLKGESGVCEQRFPTSGNSCKALDMDCNTHNKAPPTGSGKEKCAKLQKGTEATVCAKNSTVSSTGEKVVLWTREADRVILTTCQGRGAHRETFQSISRQLGTKSPREVSRRFRELMRLFHTSCDLSSEEDE